jgi:DNA polymerase III subunit epsilon
VGAWWQAVLDDEGARMTISTSWWPGPLLGFDTETTGIDVGTDRIVTAALVRRDGTQTEIRTWLIDPGVQIPDNASAIHGITTAHAARWGQDSASALEEIAHELVGALTAGVPVVAFNASFDLGLLDAELERHGLPTVPDRLGHPVRPVVDPLVLDRALAGDRPGPRTLGDLCGVYEVSQAGALHSADVDVIATLDVLAQMLARYPQLVEMDLDALHDQQVVWTDQWRAARRAERAARSETSPRPD